MSFTVNEFNGIFYASGVINSSTINNLERYFNLILNLHDDITIDIEKVTSVDYQGIMFLKALHDEAISQNKKLAIVGIGCKDIYEEFKLISAAA